MRGFSSKNSLKTQSKSFSKIPKVCKNTNILNSVAKYPVATTLFLYVRVMTSLGSHVWISQDCSFSLASLSKLTSLGPVFQGQLYRPEEGPLGPSGTWNPFSSGPLSAFGLLATPWTVAFLCPWDFPGKNTGMGCHFLLQGIFPAQVSCISSDGFFTFEPPGKPKTNTTILHWPGIEPESPCGRGEFYH